MTCRLTVHGYTASATTRACGGIQHDGVNAERRWTCDTTNESPREGALASRYWSSLFSHGRDNERTGRGRPMESHGVRWCVHSVGDACQRCRPQGWC
ncbi:hypothetical protein PAXRUDRAFT_484016 [Paxillus rubicundulus Ve08.2h10]|uniref:Unplaced genomic scaffold scaffold_320, whole genome shotgun sequence n=1 Tax=Paxillus rubicundulus Ve08.2h10 TaxID=930991 RepID=A0A0D0DW40_9AGAM|nr:hypothetical protein PAXRUDRAFT_484016 [Paxillus rubicundulus Ve08.2h10]